jgi:hypothetical protein
MNEKGKMSKEEVLAKMRREWSDCQLVAENELYEPLRRRCEVEARVWKDAIELVERTGA